MHKKAQADFLKLRFSVKMSETQKKNSLSKTPILNCPNKIGQKSTNLDTVD